MSVKLAEVAKQAEVSVSLVSRVLNDDVTLRIKPHKRARILQTWERLRQARGEQRGSSAKAARPVRAARRLTRNIVLPKAQIFNMHAGETPTPSAQFFREKFLWHLQERLQAEHFRLSIRYFDPSDREELVRDLLASFGRYWDGIVLLGVALGDEFVQVLRAKRLAHVFHGPDTQRLHLHSVTVNLRETFRPVLDHLEALGHERIGYVGAEHTDRLTEGLRPALAERGRPLNDRWCCFLGGSGLPERAAWSAYTEQGQDHVRQVVGSWIAQWKAADPGDRPTAMVCSNDLLAFGLIEAMRELGLEPARDISVVGYDNIEKHGGEQMPTARSYALTTLDNPVDVMGRRCAERLINQIVHGQHDIVYEYVPRELVVRSTTGPAPTARC